MMPRPAGGGYAPWFIPPPQTGAPMPWAMAPPSATATSSAGSTIVFQTPSWSPFPGAATLQQYPTPSVMSGGAPMYYMMAPYGSAPPSAHPWMAAVPTSTVSTGVGASLVAGFQPSTGFVPHWPAVPSVVTVPPPPSCPPADASGRTSGAGVDGATVAAAATGAAPHGDYVDGGDEPWLTQNGHNASALRGATQVAASQPLPSKAAAGVKAGVTSAPRRASEGAVNKRAGLVLEGQRGAPVANSNSVIICSQPPGATALTTTTVASAAADGGDSTPMFHCRYCEYSSRVSHSVTTHERRVSARCFL